MCHNRFTIQIDLFKYKRFKDGGCAHKILGRATLKLFGFVKPRANGRNIVGQHLPTLLDVTFCVRLYTLLHVVRCCYGVLLGKV